MDNILVIAKGLEQTRFFLRMQESSYKLGYKIIYITAHYATYLYLKKRKIKVYLIKNKYKTLVKLEESEIINSFEYKARFFSKNLIQNLYNASYIQMQEIINDNNIKYIFMWNGCQIIDKAAKQIANIQNIKTLYFEIANINGKTFVDPKGTNANSQLFDSPEILKQYNVNLNEYNKWKENYLREKFANHIVKQSYNKYSNKIEFCINRLGDIFITKFFSMNNLVSKIKEFLLYKTINFKYDNYDYKNRKYIFFPLQVSNDTQILIHSDIGIEKALEFAVIEAKKNNCDLVIKPHPAEKNSKFVENLLKKKQKEKFYFVNENTFRLIQNAKLVITINSTVGLETKIMGKTLKVLGRALYANFNQYDIAAYIQKYLIDIDYFDNARIDIKIFNKILNLR